IPLQHWTVIALALIIAALLLILASAKNSTLASRLLAIILALSALAVLFIVHWAAQVEAREMAGHVWHGRKSHSVPVLDPTAQSEPSYRQFQRCVDRGAVRQIIGLPDRMFLLCRTEFSPCVYGTMFLITDD